MASMDSGQHTISRSTILYGSSKGDTWDDLDQYYTDHIQEICHRISSLDDDIWGKIILMEKNKRIAKAYLRIPTVYVDGSCTGFDGKRIGFCSFENTTRDRCVEEIRNKIGSGVALRMDQRGNVLAKRMTTSPVVIQGIDRPDLCCFGTDVAKSKGVLDAGGKAVKVFDMKLFKNSIEQELLKPYPDWKRLKFQTLIRVTLVKDETSPLKTPCWITVINLVALDMLVNKVPIMPTSLPGGMFPARPPPLEDLNDHHHHQMINQVTCDLYGTLTPLSLAPVFSKNQLPGYPPSSSSSGHWVEATKSSSSSSNELLDQIQRNREKMWKPSAMSSGGYVSEAEGTKLMQLQCRRGRSLDTRNNRPMSQCWSTAPSVENLHNLYATVDNNVVAAAVSGRNNFNSHSLKVVGSSNAVNGKKLFPNGNGVATYYGSIKNSAWSMAGSTSDYESGRIEIYESSNSSSNSGVSMLSGSCRASSPSIVSEASESQTSDSGFADNEIAGSMQTLSSNNNFADGSVKGSKKKITKNSIVSTTKSTEPNFRSTNRRNSQTTDSTVIETERDEDAEGKEEIGRRAEVRISATNVQEQIRQLETKPTVIVVKKQQQQKVDQPVPPVRKRHQSATSSSSCSSSSSSKQSEQNFLPLSLAPPNVDLVDTDDDDDSESTKVWSF